VYDLQPKILPAADSLIWALAKETGKFENKLRAHSVADASLCFVFWFLKHLSPRTTNSARNVPHYETCSLLHILSSFVRIVLRD
jgi:hypothetical protein